VYAADKLFATLDPTVRKLQGLRCGNAVLADTVGFVRDLPHDLVAAFRSTLSEAREADLLLHVIDAADPRRDERIEEVQSCWPRSARTTSRRCTSGTRST
jgi:GTP-binding protein HflX